MIRLENYETKPRNYEMTTCAGKKKNVLFILKRGRLQNRSRISSARGNAIVILYLQ